MAEEKDICVFEVSGKQFTAALGEQVLVDKLESKAGESISIDKVLLIHQVGQTAVIGAPYISGAKVAAKVLATTKQKKVIAFKKRIKTGFQKKIGHRQQMTTLLIESITQ